jgi:two-component system chemotaxis response regulator CheB
MRYRIVVVAASAGGIQALGELLSVLPADFPIPILIVQHRADIPSLLESVFRNRTHLIVVQAKDGDVPLAGNVFFAPAGHHLLLDSSGTFRLSEAAKVNFTRPSADLLFVSAADFYRESTIGIVLTGYGVDGSHGVEAIRKMGGYVIGQEPSTSEAPSMPTAAIKTGCVDAILPLHDIGASLLELVCVRNF